MALIERVAHWLSPGRIKAADPAMNERYWTTNLSAYLSQTGQTVTPERAMMASPVWACVNAIVNPIGTTPTKVYERLSDGNRRLAEEHPVYRLFKYAPNKLQTPLVYKRLLQFYSLIWGNGYARIVAGPHGFCDQLLPIHPDLVRIEDLPDGGIRYMVKTMGATGLIEEPVNEEDMFHLQGISFDGRNGISLMAMARDSVGLSLAAQGYSAQFYRKGARPGGILKHPLTLSPDAKENIKLSWMGEYGGVDNAWGLAVLEEGMEWQPIGINNDDAQLIEQLDWSVADIARFFGVPLHKIQQMTKNTAWGTGLEEMNMEFVQDCLLPHARNWESEISRSLIVTPERYYAEFDFNYLLKGDTLKRYQAYAIGLNGGFLTPNRVAKMENLDPVPGGDEPMRPANIIPLDSPAPDNSPPQNDEEAILAPLLPKADSGHPPARLGGHYTVLLYASAQRVVNREIKALEKQAAKHADDPRAWETAVGEFCLGHAEFVQQVMGIGFMAAEGYIMRLEGRLLQHGAKALEDTNVRLAELVDLALSEGEGNA